MEALGWKRERLYASQQVIGENQINRHRPIIMWLSIFAAEAPVLGSFRVESCWSAKPLVQDFLVDGWLGWTWLENNFIVDLIVSFWLIR